MFGLVMSYGPSEPGHTLAPLLMESKQVYLGVSSTYPWLRSRRRNLYSVIGFDAVDSDVDLLDEPFSRDRLRVLHAGGSYDFIDPRGGQSKLGFSVRQGLPVLGASDNDDPLRSRAEGKSDFTSLQFHGLTNQSVFDVTRWQIAAKGQYAFDTLLSDEEFRLGGEQFGRGYDPSELAGEHGLGLSMELQRTLPTRFEALPDYQLYGFYDVGIVWNEDTGAQPRASLASAGFGVRARAYDSITLGLELAKPLTREVAAEGNKDPRVYFQVSAHY
jgi:hemolysin activation/secretion protein